MSKINDEQFSAEVEKRLQNLFSDSDDEHLIAPQKEEEDIISSEEDLLDDIMEEDLLEEDTSQEEDSLELISEADLLNDDHTENLSDDDLDDDVLDDDLNENLLDDDLNDDLFDDELNEDLLDDSSNKPGGIECEDVSIKEDGEFQFYPFRLLKSIILSIDWEITDDIMDRFVSQVTGLMETYKDDRFVLIFLHLLWELGKYIKKHQGQSHPNSIKTLNSVYNALEKILSSKELSDSDKKKILSVEMLRFKTLKEQITLQHEDTPNKNASHVKIVEKSNGKFAETTVSDEMIEIIKAIVQTEFKAFIKEFAEWASKR
ncbi:MAG: hypothetical protein V2B19_28965 [Pseudomonadota bacterium]